MRELYDKIKHYTLEDALNFEKKDRQFIALKRLYENSGKNNFSGYLVLIICNAIICYQLSGKGEDYWEEFSEYFSLIEIDKKNIISNLIKFIKQSKNNRRLLDVKINRLNKLINFVETFDLEYEIYCNNMIKLLDDLSKIMNQKKDSKTIVFGIKMFGYGLKNKYDFGAYPADILIPIDSRLTNIYEKYKGNYLDIKNFYNDLCIEMGLSPLNLDSIIWNKYSELV